MPFVENKAYLSLQKLQHCFRPFIQGEVGQRYGVLGSNSYDDSLDQRPPHFKWKLEYGMMWLWFKMMGPKFSFLVTATLLISQFSLEILKNFYFKRQKKKEYKNISRNKQRTYNLPKKKGE